MGGISQTNKHKKQIPTLGKGHKAVIEEADPTGTQRRREGVEDESSRQQLDNPSEEQITHEPAKQIPRVDEEIL